VEGAPEEGGQVNLCRAPSRLPVIRHIATLVVIIYLLGSGKLASLNYRQLQGLVARWQGKETC